MRITPGAVGVVTGAASGIGLALAAAVGERQMRLVVADIDGERLESESEALRRAGVIVVTARTDVSSPEAVEALAELAWSEYGAVHVVCNNAGVLEAALSWEYDIARWRRVLDINLGGVVNGIRAFVPRMIRNGVPGHVVNLASMAAYVPRPGIAAYNASKAGVVAVSETLAMDLMSVGSKLGVSVVIAGRVESRLSSDISGGGDGPGRPTAVSATGLRSAGDTATQIVAAIETEKFYVFTHPERYEELDSRWRAVRDAFRGEPTDAQALISMRDETQSTISREVRSVHRQRSGER